MSWSKRVRAEDAFSQTTGPPNYVEGRSTPVGLSHWVCFASLGRVSQCELGMTQAIDLRGAFWHTAPWVDELPSKHALRMFEARRMIPT